MFNYLSGTFALSGWLWFALTLILQGTILGDITLTLATICAIFSVFFAAIGIINHISDYLSKRLP